MILQHLILFALAVSAQTKYTVSGRILDVDTKSPVEAATCRIFSTSDTIHPIVSDITDMHGVFSQSVPKAGHYILQIEHFGTNPKKCLFSVSDEIPAIDLDDILIENHTSKLNEVTVVTTMPLIKSDGNKISYNIKQDPTSKTSSVIEILRKVPLVTVDADDNIRVNGSSDFKIYVNGKPNPMLSSNVKTILKAMPASSIQKIEVITDPDAKFDAEGIGGILNFVTETKQKFDGYLANIQLQLTNRQEALGLYGRVKVNKVTASALFSGAFLPPSKQVGNAVTNYHTTGTYLESSTRQAPQTVHYIGGNFDLSWEPDTLNLFTVSANIQSVNAGIDLAGDSRMFLSTGIPLWSYKMNGFANVENIGISSGTSYQHTFGKPGHHLIISYQFDYGKNDLDVKQYYNDLENYFAYAPYTYQDKNNGNSSHTIQADFALPVTNDKHLIEVGAKGLFRRNRADSRILTGQDEISAKPNDDDGVNMNQFQDIAVLYGSYSGKYGNFNLGAGLRYEYTHMGVDFTLGKYNNFTTILNDIVPNISLDYNFNSQSNFRVAYSTRISRPSISELNPYYMKISEETGQKGNPNLNSEKSHNISLTYSNFIGKVSGRVSLAYNLSNNHISQVAITDDTSIIYTYENCGRRNRGQFAAYINWQIIPRMNLSLNSTLSYSHFNTHSSIPSSAGWDGNIGLNWNYMLPSNWRFSVYGTWNSRRPTVEGYIGGFYSYGLGINKSFLKNNMLNVGITAGSFLQRYTTFKSYVSNAQVSNWTINKKENWSIGISVAYTIGNLYSDVKKTNTGSFNDDKVQTEEKGGIAL